LPFEYESRILGIDYMSWKTLITGINYQEKVSPELRDKSQAWLLSRISWHNRTILYVRSFIQDAQLQSSL